MARSTVRTEITGKVWKEDVWAYCHGGDVLLPPEKVFAKRDRRVQCKRSRTSGEDCIEKPFDVEAYIRES